jgi:hypothetical protein
MRKSVLFLIGCCTLICLIAAKGVQAEATKYVEVTSSFAKVYRYLDPKSEVLKLAKKGEFYELVYEGTAWYQIKIKESVGWLEHRAGQVTDAPRFMFFSVSFWTLAMFIILLLGTLGGVAYMIYRQKNAETET